MIRRTRLVAFAVVALLAAGSLFAQTSEKRKVFLDQDGAGPAGTDTLSVLALLQSPDVEVLGVAITAGGVWVKEGVRNMLRILELTGHEKVPVAHGGEQPLINSREETQMWERQWGEFSYKGAWNPGRYHEPDVIPPGYPAGEPTIKAVSTHSAQLLIAALRRNPNEVTVWVGGPFTTVALALRLDPGIAVLAKGLVVMGAGFNVDKGWQPPHQRAARIQLVVGPGSDAHRAIITKQQELYVNVDIDHVASYGQTIFVEPAAEPAPGQPPVPRKIASWWRVATVQWDLDVTRFYDQFADLMSK